MGKFLYLLIHSSVQFKTVIYVLGNSVQFKMVIYVLGNAHNYVINRISWVYNAENLNFCVHGTIQQGAEQEAVEEVETVNMQDCSTIIDSVLLIRVIMSNECPLVTIKCFFQICISFDTGKCNLVSVHDRVIVINLCYW